MNNRYLPSPAQAFPRYDIWTMGGSGRDIRSISGIDRVSLYVYPLLWDEGNKGIWRRERMDEWMNEWMNWLTRRGIIYILVMDRDRRLTGWLRGQTDKVEAPVGFEVNNPWKVSFLSRCVGSCGGVGSGEFVLIIWGGWGFSSWRGGISDQGGGGFISSSLLCTITRRIHVQTRQTIKLLLSRIPCLSFSGRSISKQYFSAAGLSPLVERLFTILATICCLTSLFTITQELVESLHPRAGWTLQSQWPGWTSCWGGCGEGERGVIVL